jgi:hypothetical protein
MAIFEHQNQSHLQNDCFWRWALVVILTLAFGIQTKKVVLECQNQAIFNMTAFDGADPRCGIDTCFWYPNKKSCFGIPKSSHLQYDCFWRWILVGILTLAFGAQTKTPCLDWNQVVFQSIWYFLREGSWCQTKNLLYWNILTDCIFCTGMALLSEYFVLEYPYWLHILYWNGLTAWVFCTGMA